MGFAIDAPIVLLIFYVYLLARWQYVKRPLFYLVGVAGLVFGMISMFLGSGEYAGVVARFFTAFGVIVAFLAAVGACYGAQLPIKIPGDTDAK